MNPEIYIEQILDDYLMGNIPLTEAEKLLSPEPTSVIGDMIAMHQAAAIALQRSAVIAQVKKVHNQFVASHLPITVQKDSTDIVTKAKVRSISPLKWLVRVAAVLIVFVSAWYVYQINAASSSKLYGEMYQAYNVNTERAPVDEIVPHNMIQEYKDRNFAAVIKTYKSLPSTTNREKFLTAMAYHETGDYQQTVDLLTAILRDNEQKGGRLYNDEAEFYTGLSYLKMKKGELAFPFFQKIYKTPGHTFHERVTKWTMTRLKWIK
jgi:tetratricopeptide (TPR) repeat protein